MYKWFLRLSCTEIETQLAGRVKHFSFARRHGYSTRTGKIEAYSGMRNRNLAMGACSAGVAVYGDTPKTTCRERTCYNFNEQREYFSPAAYTRPFGLSTLLWMCPLLHCPLLKKTVSVGNILFSSCAFCGAFISGIQ